MMYRFIIRGRNCAEYIRHCMTSLGCQTMSNWTAHIVLDQPEDKSLSVVGDYLHTTAIRKKFSAKVNDKRLGLARNIYEFPMLIAKTFKPEDVLCFVDADDFLRPDALQYVDTAYKSRKDCLLTYGSYIKLSKGRKTSISQPYPEGADVREYPWRASHLKTVKVKLFKRLPELCMRDEKGKWLEAASDLAIMIPLIEMAGLARCAHVAEPIYMWRNNTPFKTKRKLQAKCEATIRKKHKLEKVQVVY